VPNPIIPGERNPIKGRFGQAKTAYGLNRIRARLIETRESMISCIVLVLNLVKLAGVVALFFFVKYVSHFSASCHENAIRIQTVWITNKIMFNKSKITKQLAE
jgi:hypothetical protein